MVQNIDFKMYEIGKKIKLLKISTFKNTYLIHIKNTFNIIKIDKIISIYSY